MMDGMMNGMMKSSRGAGLCAALKWALLVACLPTAGIAMPLLSEVYYDAAGSDDGEVFVELSGAPGTSLDGFFLDGINGSNGAVGPTIALSGQIGANGLFVVADQTAEGSTSVVSAALLANFDFQNGPDSVVLRFGEQVVDALGYGVFSTDEIFAGEGTAAPDVAAGASLARVFANLDTNDNSVDFQIASTPTPGTASFAPVPEPGASLMIGLGLGGLAMAGGRQSRASRSTLRIADRPLRAATVIPSMRNMRRQRAWQRKSTGIISGRVERPAPEHPSFWMPKRS